MEDNKTIRSNTDQGDSELHTYVVEIMTAVGDFTARKNAINGQAAIDAVLEEMDRGGVTLENGKVFRQIPHNNALLVLLAEKQQEELEHTGTDPEPEESTPLTVSFHAVVGWLDQTVEYLGSKYSADFITTRIQEADYFKVYILMYALGGKPAASALSESGQVAVIHEWINTFYTLNEEGKTAKWTFYPVIPHGAITELDEAFEYLKDYVAETAPEHKPVEKNATAFHGWKDRSPKGAE